MDQPFIAPISSIRRRVIIAGVTDTIEVLLAAAKLAVSYDPGRPNGSSATIPMRLQSSATAGTPSVHLERAPFAGTSATAQSLTLTVGPCVDSFPMVVFAPIDVIVPDASKLEAAGVDPSLDGTMPDTLGAVAEKDRHGLEHSLGRDVYREHRQVRHEILGN